METRLDNASLGLILDRRGNLQSLVNRRTGWEYLTASGLSLWQMIYPGLEDPESPIRSEDQAPPNVSLRENTLTVHHASVRDFRGRRLSIALTWSACLRGEELVFTVEVANSDAVPVHELWFPTIGGLGSLGADGGRAFLLYPESAGRRVRDPVRNLADRAAQPVRGARFNFLRLFYPGAASMQWMGLYGERGSLYVGSHDRTLQTTTLNAVLNVGRTPTEDSVSLGFIKYPFAAPGAVWRSEPFVIAVHSGSWHADARRYRAFADTWQDHRRPKPDWVRDMPAMHDVILLHQYGRVSYRYDQIPEVAAAAAAGGIDVVKLSGWAHGGHDNMYPDFRPSEPLGGEAALVRNLRGIRERGGRSVLYFHFLQMSPNSEFYRRHGEFCAMKGPYGNPFIDIFTWPSHGTFLLMNERFQLINACVGTEPWQEHVLDCVRRGLAWGADCVFLDQTAGAPSSFLCFDRRHGHPTPALACGPGKTRLSERAREMVRAHGPEAALGAEYIADCILQYYDFTIPFGLGFFYEGQHFGEMYRFTFPEDVLLTQYMARENDEQMLYSFVMGYRFFLAPRQQCAVLTDLDPRFVRRLAGLVALRRRLGSLLMQGVFRDVEPLEIGNPSLVARAFEAGAGPAAAAVWNPTATEQGLLVKWPGRRLTETERPDGAWAAGPDVLGPNETAVLLFR